MPTSGVDFSKECLCFSSSDLNVQEDYKEICDVLKKPPESPCSSSSFFSSPSGGPDKETRKQLNSEEDGDTESVASSSSKGAETLHYMYRRKLSSFFADPENYKRLETFVYHKDTEEVYSIFLFFLVRVCESKFLHTIRSYDRKEKRQTVYCPKDEYNRALRKYQKRFYNFEDKAGQGDVFWKGVRNPRFLVAAKNGPISLPIAKLIALYWAIDYGFDVVFWKRYDEVKEQYVNFVQKTKKRYTETHKNKKKRIREEEEEAVIQERKRKEEEEIQRRIALGLPVKKTKRRKKNSTSVSRPPTRLTRVERQVVANRINARNLKEAVDRRQERALKKKRKSSTGKPKKATSITTPQITY